MTYSEVLARAEAGRSLARAEAVALADCPDTRALMRVATSLRDAAHGGLVSYSRKVFIPLTQLCRDVCHYCTFAHPPRAGETAYLSAEQVLEIARAGAQAGCHEALFTLGEHAVLSRRNGEPGVARD
jgi:FO synthase